MSPLPYIGPQTGTIWEARDEEGTVVRKRHVVHESFGVAVVFKLHRCLGTIVENVELQDYPVLSKEFLSAATLTFVHAERLFRTTTHVDMVGRKNRIEI